MALYNADYGKNWATFDFNVKEPPVARGNIVHYFTPRGLHICVSQVGMALVENMVKEGLVEDISIPEFRNTVLEGRLKITELYQKFRKEVGLSKPLPGRIDVARFRQGRIPVLKLNFDFGNRAVNGNLVSVIAPKPTHQLNADLMRNPI